MDDLISRQAAIDIAEKAFIRGLLATPDLRRLPAAQPEIVRCKDCKYGECSDYWCALHNTEMEPETFCSYGEKEEE